MVSDVAASVRQRLMNLARQRQDNFNFLLMKYAIERLLYRLSVSEYSETFILKGATLFSIWNDEPHRPTRDIDFLGICSNDLEVVRTIFANICEITVEDGILFDVQSISVVEIKEDAEYSGVRVKLVAYLQRAKANIQIDIGFNDVIVPEAILQKLPTLLDFPAPELKAYPVYSVVAEKLQAMCSLGEANSRMKDFYDLWNIINTQELEPQLLNKAIMATFQQRNTKFEASSIIFEDTFMNDEERNRMWLAYLKKLGISGIEFSDVMKAIQQLVKQSA